jgi:hypothetical protein
MKLLPIINIFVFMETMVQSPVQFTAGALEEINRLALDQ